MKQSIYFFTTVILYATITVTLAQTKKKPASTTASSATKTATASLLKNHQDSVSYAFGINGARYFTANFTDLNIQLLTEGFSKAAANKPVLLSDSVANMIMVEYQKKALTQRLLEQLERNKMAGQRFLAENKKQPGVRVLPDGIQMKLLQQGMDSTLKPSINDTVVCHYIGKLIDGREFDNSTKRNSPVTFAVGDVIRGWQVVLPLMNVGSKWEVTIPSDMAYGDTGAPPKIEPGATLVFEIYLLDIKHAKK